MGSQDEIGRYEYIKLFGFQMASKEAVCVSDPFDCIKKKKSLDKRKKLYESTDKREANL